MRASPEHVSIANELRKFVQECTESIDDGEGIAMILLWSFLADHAKCHGLDVSKLAREQLEAFIPYAEENLNIVMEH